MTKSNDDSTIRHRKQPGTPGRECVFSTRVFESKRYRRSCAAHAPHSDTINMIIVSILFC